MSHDMLTAPPDSQSTRQGADGIATTATWTKFALIMALLSFLAVAAYWMSPQAMTTVDGPRLTHTIAAGDLAVTVTEQGTLESAENTEIKCKVRGFSTVTWVVESGTSVQPGDELVRLDTKAIQETVSLAKTNTHTAHATLAKSQANVAAAQIALESYLTGPYLAQRTTLDKQLTIAQEHLNTSQTMLAQSETLFKRGYITEEELEGNAFTVTQAQLEVNVRKTAIEVLEKFTKEMQLTTMKGNLTASRSKLQADQEGLAMEESVLERAQRELKDCVIVADRAGLVIYPSAAAWKDTPDIAEGVTVRKDQTLLLMPDLTQMQVKVGVHESIIDRMRPGLKARVTLPDRTLEAEVTSVASVTRPAGWWTGNVVKYDTVIALPKDTGLKPGMSAEVQILLAEHQNVLTIPVAAIVDTEKGPCCWVKTPQGPAQRALTLGDGNDIFLIVESGLQPGEEVVLQPLAYVEAAQQATLRTLDDRPSLDIGPETDSTDLPPRGGD